MTNPIHQHEYVETTDTDARPDRDRVETEPHRETVQPSGWLAGLRIVTGLVFLWAFLDKLFGLGYSTPRDGAWLRGGSPTEGFLGSIDAGPLASTFRAMAGDWWVDWLFMLGLLAVGVVITLGTAMRVGAVIGALLVGLMWLAEWHPARYTSAGELTRSTNPLVDYHVVYVLVFAALAVTAAGDRWGFGRAWKRLPLVRRHASILT